MKGLLKFKNEAEYNSAKIECTNVSYLIDKDLLKLKQYVEKTYYPLHITYNSQGASKDGFYISYDSSFISKLPYMSINGGEMIETSGQYYYDGDNVTFYSTTPITNIDFLNSENIYSIDIPYSVTSISNEAFDGWDKLCSVNFEENSQCTSIGDYAFYNCKNLLSIEIPSSVTEIGSYIINGCDNLEEIKFYSMTPTFSFYYSFNHDCSLPYNGTLLIPQGASGYDVILSQINNENKCTKGWRILYF